MSLFLLQHDAAIQYIIHIYKLLHILISPGHASRLAICAVRLALGGAPAHSEEILPESAAGRSLGNYPGVVAGVDNVRLGLCHLGRANCWGFRNRPVKFGYVEDDDGWRTVIGCKG